MAPLIFHLWYRRASLIQTLMSDSGGTPWTQVPWLHFLFFFQLSACKAYRRLQYTPATIQPPHYHGVIKQNLPWWLVFTKEYKPLKCLINPPLEAITLPWGREGGGEKIPQILGVQQCKTTDNSPDHNSASDYHLTPSERNQQLLSIYQPWANHRLHSIQQ